MRDAKNLKLYSLAVAIISSIICYFFSARAAVSIIVGQMSFQLYYQLLSVYYTISVNSENIRLRWKTFVAFISKLFRIIILAIPYLLAGFYPDKLHFLAIFIGQMIFKIILMLDAILQVVKNINRKEKE